MSSAQYEALLVRDFDQTVGVVGTRAISGTSRIFLTLSLGFRVWGLGFRVLGLGIRV